MAKHRPPTEAKLLELLETVYPTKTASSSEHNLRHFVESTAKDQGLKQSELKAAASDIRSLITKACEDGVVSSERQWAVMCRRIDQRIQKTKNTLRFALLSKRIQEAIDWAREEVHAATVSFDTDESPAAAEPALPAAAEPVVTDQPRDDDEAAFMALLAQEEEEAALAALIEEEEAAAERERALQALTESELGAVDMPAPTMKPSLTPERMDVAPSFFGTIEAERGQRTPEAFLRDRMKEFAWAMFDEEFLPALRKHERELRFEDALSLETAKRIIKLVGLLERKIDELMDARMPALLATLSSFPPAAAETEEIFMHEIWRTVREALAATEAAIKDRILLHGVNPNKTELPRVVLGTFLSHCLESGRSYLDIVTEPANALTELPGMQLRHDASATGKAKTIEMLRRERVLQHLIPTRCTGDEVPLSASETEYLARRIEGKGRINNAMRAELMRELQEKFTGGAPVRSEHYFRAVVEPAIAEIIAAKRERERSATPRPRAAVQAPAPAKPSADLSPAEQRAAALKSYVEKNVATPHEVTVLAELSRNKAHRKSIHQGKFDAIATIVNEQCWAGQPERDAQFVENVIAAIRIGIVHPAAPLPEASAPLEIAEEAPVSAIATEPEAVSAAEDEATPAELSAETTPAFEPASDDRTTLDVSPANPAPADEEQSIADVPAEAATSVEETTFVAPSEAPEAMTEPLKTEAAAEIEPAVEPTEAAPAVEIPAAPEATEKRRAQDAYASRLLKEITTHATMRTAPLARMHAMVGDVLRLADEGEQLLESYQELLEGRQNEMDALRMGAALLTRGDDISEDRMCAVCHVSSPEELRSFAERFLADARSQPEKLEKLETDFASLREQANLINKDLRTAQQFFARDLQRITLTSSQSEAEHFVLDLFGEDAIALLSEEDSGVEQAKQDIQNALDNMMQGVLRDLLEYKDIARRVEDATAIAKALAPKKKNIDRAPRGHAVHDVVAGHPINGEALTPSEALKLTVAKMTMGTKKEQKTYDISLLQARLLQLLIVFPNVVPDGDGDDVKPRSKSYKKLWHGRGPWELAVLWKEMFGEESPPKEEIAIALHALASEGRKGMAANTAGPAAAERESAVTPLMKFCNRDGHLKFVPAEPTYDFVRSLNGPVAMTSEFEEKLAGLLDAKARAKQEKSKSMRRPKQ